MVDNSVMNANALYALGAAFLFGASTPLAKHLSGDMPSLLLAGLLYLGSGLGLTLARLLRDRGFKHADLPRHEWPWLGGAILFGGILGPVALMAGLVTTRGSTASLLLNLEAVLTALIAWMVFKESAERRIVLGMLAIVAGGVALGWPTDMGGNRSHDRQFIKATCMTQMTLPDAPGLAAAALATKVGVVQLHRPR